MDVTVLGSGAAYARPGGACAGFLVSSGDTHIWIDAGNGTFSRLWELVSLDQLDALILTHAHADHISDVLPLMYALGLSDDPRPHPLPVYAPKQIVAARVGAMLGAQSFEMFQRVFDLRPINGGTFEVGSVSFEPFRTQHPGETYGLRISAGGRLAVYTSDTAIFPELADHCRDADLLVCEATYVEARKADPGVHMWAREAGTVAKQAGVKQLVLTHILPAFDTEQAVKEAAEEFDGPIEAAVEGKRYKI